MSIRKHGLIAVVSVTWATSVACGPENDTVGVQGASGASGGGATRSSSGVGASGGQSSGGASGASGTSGESSGGASGASGTASGGSNASGGVSGASGGTIGGDPSGSVPGLRLRLDLLTAGEGSTGLHGIVPFADGSLVGYGYERLSDGNIDAFLMKFNADGGIAWATHFGGGGADDLNGVAEGAGGAIFAVGQASGKGIVVKLDGAGKLQSAITLQTTVSGEPGDTQILGSLHGIVATGGGFQVVGDAGGSGAIITLDSSGAPARAGIASQASTFNAIAASGAKLLVAGSSLGAAVGLVASQSLQLEQVASFRAGSSSRFDGVAAFDGGALLFVGRSNGGDSGIERGWMLRASSTMQVQASVLALGSDVADSSGYRSLQRLGSGDYLTAGSRGVGAQKPWVVRFDGATLAGRAVTVDPGFDSMLGGATATAQALWAVGTRVESGRDQPVRVTLPLGDFGVTTACGAALQTDPMATIEVATYAELPSGATLLPVVVNAIPITLASGTAEGALSPFCY